MQDRGSGAAGLGSFPANFSSGPFPVLLAPGFERKKKTKNNIHSCKKHHNKTNRTGFVIVVLNLSKI